MKEARYTQLLTWIIIVAGAAVCLFSVYGLPVAQLDLRFLLLSLITLCLSSYLIIQIPRADIHISVSDTFVFLMLLLYGGEAAILLATAEALFSSLRLNKKRIRIKPLTILCNAAITANSTFLTVWVLRRCFDPLNDLTTHRYSAAFFSALCIMALVQYTASTAQAALITAGRTNETLWSTWRKHYLWASITYFAGAAAAGIIVRLVGEIGIVAIMIATPIISIIFFTYERYIEDIKASSAQAERAERERAEQAEAHVKELSHHIAEQERISLALQASEVRFRTAFDSAAIGMALVGLDGRWLQVNRSLCGILGYSEPELLAMNFQAITHPEDLGTNLVYSYQLAEGITSSYQTEKRYIHKLGHDVWVQLNASLVRDAQGKPLHFITQIQDITQHKQAREALRESEKQYRNLFENTPIGIYRTTPDGRILMANPALIKMLGYSSYHQLASHNLESDYFDASYSRNQFKECIEREGVVKGLEAAWTKRDGSQVFVRENARAIRGVDGTIQYYEGTVEDITERKRAEAALLKAEENYRSIFENAVEGIFQSTADGRFITANPALARMLGYESPAELLRDRTDLEFQHYVDPEGRAEFKRQLAEHDIVKGFESQAYRRDGTTIWTLENVRAVRHTTGELLYYEGTIEDITERKRAEEHLFHIAFHDSLTGLANRALLTDQLSRSVSKAKRRKDHLVAVLFLDLDRFKYVNDSLGHPIGDQLLIAVARRLKHSTRNADTVARLGGDEFAVLLDGITDTSEAIRMAERLQKELALPFNINGHEVFTTASIGIAVRAADYDQPEEILRDADTAMYRAKSSGKARYELFDEAMHTRAVTLLRLENDLRRAIERHEFRVHYQPIVSLDTGRVAGFEALVRWAHPERGLVPPGEFIPLAEETGLITEIGRWVLREACHQTRQWQLDSPICMPLTISVNLSSKQLTQQGIIEQITGILDETGLDPCCLKLEITESAVMENTEVASRILQQLRDLDVRLSIDDFGTGYSSLSYLHRFPINTLKIDRSFINQVGRGDANSEIVRTIVALANNLGMDVVAEGVETEEQLEYLKTLKCAYGQGYLFSKPVDGETARKILQERSQGIVVSGSVTDNILTSIDVTSHVN